jgi:hypothetical protein
LQFVLVIQKEAHLIFRFNFFLPVGLKIGAVLKGPADMEKFYELRGTNFEYAVDALFFSFSPSSPRTSRRRGRNVQMRIDPFIILYLIEPSQTNPNW